MDFNKIKKVGPILRFVYNLFLAGKVITIKGKHIKLPQLNSTPAITSTPINFETLLDK